MTDIVWQDYNYSDNNMQYGYVPGPEDVNADPEHTKKYMGQPAEVEAHIIGPAGAKAFQDTINEYRKNQEAKKNVQPNKKVSN